MANYTTLDIYQTAQHLSPTEDRRIEDIFQAIIDLPPFSPDLESSVCVTEPYLSQCNTNGLPPTGIAKAPSVYAGSMDSSAEHSQLTQLAPVLVQPDDEYAQPVTDWVFSCTTPYTILDDGISAISFADKDVQQATLISDPWNSPECFSESICPSGALAVFPWPQSMAPDLYAPPFPAGLSTSTPYDPLASSYSSHWSTSQSMTGESDVSYVPLTPALFSMSILTPPLSSSSNLEASSPDSSVQNAFSPSAWSSSDEEGDILPNGYFYGSDSDASSPVQAPPRLPPLTQRNAFKRSHKSRCSASSSSPEILASSPPLSSSSSDLHPPRRSIKRTSVTSRADRAARTTARRAKQSSRRSIQAPPGFAYPAVLPSNLVCPIPGCYHVQENKRKSDFKRHVNVHFEGIDEVCRGVPKDLAHLYGATEEQLKNATYYPELKMEMVGGCGTSFARPDAYQRHMKDNCTCLADIKGEWHETLREARNRNRLDSTDKQ